MNKSVIFKHKIEDIDLRYVDIDFIKENDVLGKEFRFLKYYTPNKYDVIIYDKIYHVNKCYFYTNEELRKIKLKKLCIK